MNRILLKLMCACLLLVSSQYMKGENKQELARFKGTLKVNANCFGVHVKKCPGQISGDKGCVRTMYFIRQASLSLNDFKKAVYNVEKGDTILIISKLDAKLIIYFSDLCNDEKNVISNEIESSNSTIDIVSPQYVIEKKRKNRLYSNKIIVERAYLFNASCEFINEKLGNRIQLHSEEESVPIVIVF